MKSQILIILFFLPLLIHAQGGFIIEENTHVVIEGNPNLIINNGKFVNDGNFDADNSTVIFTGSAPTAESTIGGTTNTVFNNLTISKSLNNVRLDYDVDVNGDVEMSGGLLILNYSDIILGGSLIGETETSRITGPDGGAIIKTVDLNAPAAENPGNLGIEITTSENLGSTTIRRGHVPYDNEGNYSINRYFSIDPANNSNLDATIRIHYFDAELEGQVEGDLNIWRYDDTDWISFGSESSNTSDNWVETSNIPFFYIFTLSEEMGILPIELLEFNAVVNERKQVELNWITSAEINNDYFTIERSQNGVEFEELHDISGAGNSTQPRYYESLDPNPLPGTSYYRLRQTDFDGTQTVSEIRVVNIELHHQFSVYPNPLKEVLHIVSDGTNNGKTEIKIVDALGNMRFYQRLDLNDQMSTIDIHEVGKFEAGNYFLSIQTGSDLANFKLVKVDD